MIATLPANGKKDAILDLNYDNLLFVDLDGKPINGRICNIIYEDGDLRAEVRIILDEHGNVVDMYMGDQGAGSWTRELIKSSDPDRVTVDPTTVTITTGGPAGSESRPTHTLPASTIGSEIRSAGVLSTVTPAPYVHPY
ncbi:hypothetical protein N7490_010210 [Penicillium lividum]|nr:hypothetical protein N7490_010210 [Penicillium lividum]